MPLSPSNAPPASLPSPAWSLLPESYRIPAAAPSLDVARAYCRRLAKTHYENFSVATWFLPSKLRQHFYNVYAYCRVSDDLGDEVGNPQQSLELLGQWESELNACYAGSPRHPVFVALAETVRKFSIPKSEFSDLLVAFRQDQTVTRFATFEDILGYCRYSANPVGHLVLYLCGYNDAGRQQLSDSTCTALQLANFWQDVAVDYAKGRIYLPLEDLRRFGVAENDIADRKATPQFIELMRFEVRRAREWFERGLPLVGKVGKHLAIDLELFTRGGQEILSAIERQGFDVLRQRPAMSKGRKAWLVARGSKQGPMNQQLSHAYAVCNGVARRTAKNFYYGFLVLPSEKRNALCAVYAFMRHADDVSDDPNLDPAQKREKLAAWLQAANKVFAGQATDDPVLMALADAQQRFKVPPQLFEKLVQGTSMDLDLPQAGDVPAIVCRTFDDLKHYCYYVASIVGLVCIRIFGYADKKAEFLAEDCGLAFQLTNIIRDVKEDAGLGRIYIPGEDLARFNLAPGHLAPSGLSEAAKPQQLRPVLEYEADRARRYYESAKWLMELIEEDSRPALWVLVEIYSRLLKKITARNYDVLSERVSLTVWEKLRVLSRGFLLRLA